MLFRNQKIIDKLIFTIPLKEKIIQNIKYLLPLAIFIILLVILYSFVSNLENKPLKESFDMAQKKINEENISDVDGDGLLDEIEFILGSDAYSADTDKDGHNDYDELKNGYNLFIVSPDDKLDENTYNLVKEILFSGKTAEFSDLNSLRLKLKDQNEKYQDGIKNDKLIAGECNLHDKIGDYNLKDSYYFIIKPEDVEFYPKGAVSKTAISYTAPPYISSKVLGSGRLYEIPYFEAEITITNFDSSITNITNIIEEKNIWSSLPLANVGVSIVSIGRFKECKIENIRGFCSSVEKVYATGKKTYEATATFLWQDNNMLKVIELQGGKADEDFSEKEKKTLDGLALFAPAIKDCKIENK